MDISEKILFVDDEPDILSSFKRQFRNKAEISTANSGQEALDLMDSEGEFAVIVSDMRMPNMDGAEFLEKAKKKSPNTVRILLTGQTDQNSAIAAINKGQIFSFLSKPCPQDILQDTLKSAIGQYRLINTEKDLLKNTVKGTIELLSELLAIVKPHVFSNFNRIRKYIRHMADELGEVDTWDFEVAAMLYSLGYLTLPEELIEKALNPNSELSSHEKLVLQDIPLISSKMINHIPRLENIAEMVRLSNKVNHLIHNGVEEVQGRILLGADMLKIALKFDKVLESGHNLKSAINLLKQDDELNPDFIEKLSNIQVGLENDALTVNVNNLLPGMVLLEDMITDNQSTLLAKGTELTKELLVRIRLYTQNQKMSRPIKIVALN
ncbi:MAG: response regulator RpfG family c-di-GMP phosphodiesterase [Glaciecola sp.]